MGRLDGKVAVVLGAATLGNMGQAIARRFASAGAQVVVAGRHAESLEALAASLDGAWVCCDITQEGDLAELAATASRRFGGLDIAVNAVGANLVKPFLEVTRAELDAVVATQFTGTFLFLQAMLRSLRDGGSIIQISSVTSIALLRNHAAYMATKAAGDTLVRSAAYDFGDRGIRVNSLSPGPTLDTPMAAALMSDPARVQHVRNKIPLKRIGTAQDVADAALWLAGDECFVTGENLQVNGGHALHRIQESAP